MRLGELGENFRVEDFGFDFSWVIWGGEVLGEGEGLGMGSLRNGFGVGFLGGVFG